MNTFEESGEAFVDATGELWEDLVSFLPDLFAGILILIVGIILSSILGALATRAVKMAQLDRLSEDSKTTKQLRDSGVTFSPSGLVGTVVKWFFLIVTFIAVADVLGLSQVTDFLNQVILYIPNVIAAVLILIVGIVLGDFMQKVVSGSARASRVIEGDGAFLGSVTRWAIVLFAIFAALTQLGVAEDLIKIVVAGFALSLAIAVGLGAKDKVKSMFERM